MSAHVDNFKCALCNTKLIFFHLFFFFNDKNAFKNTIYRSLFLFYFKKIFLYTNDGKERKCLHYWLWQLVTMETSDIQQACLHNDRGSAVGKIIGENVLKYSDVFEEEVRQWVFEENYRGEKLTDVINRERENPKYLPGIKFPPNIRAVPNLVEATKSASVLVFVLPHQFVRGVCEEMKGHIAPNARAISLIKGLEILPEKVTLFSEEISRKLGINVASLSGANIADEVAKERFCETTIGCQNKEDGELFHKLFNTDYFKVNVIRDYVGVELCGALKNVVAVGAGISDGLG